MRIKKLLAIATNKENFKDLNGFFDFTDRYLEFIERGLQAKIVSQNELNYIFFQYKRDGHYNISRPINSNLLVDANSYNTFTEDLKKGLKNEFIAKRISKSKRLNLTKTIYTTQQTIGACLDALPAGESNKARKLTGDYFERLINFLIHYIGFDCESGWINIPVKESGQELFKMKYQHDLLIKKNNSLRVIGSVKTSSKDRIDKIYIDKFLFSKLSRTQIPHIAVFLNDVQRKNTKSEQKYGITSTFLPGRFKGYTIKLNPLDGVYYCDIRPNMKTDQILKDHIKTIDNLLCEDIWQLTKN